MIVLIYLYKIFILPICSLIVNGFYFFSNPYKYILAARLFKQYKAKHIEQLEAFTYIPDWVAGWFNFEPTGATFIRRHGADCSGWARMFYRALKREKKKPEMWLLYNKGDFRSWHIITSYFDGEFYYTYNVTQKIQTQDANELFKMFESRPMVQIGGQPYTYDKLTVYRWW